MPDDGPKHSPTAAYRQGTGVALMGTNDISTFEVMFAFGVPWNAHRRRRRLAIILVLFDLQANVWFDASPVLSATLWRSLLSVDSMVIDG